MTQTIKAGDAVGLIGLGVMGRGVALNLIKSGSGSWDAGRESLPMPSLLIIRWIVSQILFHCGWMS